jgi:hypothetical protein
MRRSGIFGRLGRSHSFRLQRRLFLWRYIINPFHPADRVPIQAAFFEQPEPVRADRLNHRPAIRQHLHGLDL